MLAKLFKLKLVIFLSILSFVVFFYPSFGRNKLIVGTGSSDALSMHYPFRFYLYEKIVEEHRFPFWTERLHSGFPIYADLEKGYLSPINIVLTIIFGPLVSFKLLYFIFYITGSLGFYGLLKEYKIGIRGWLVANLIYYFTFFHILKLQLFNSVLVTYTLPLNLYFIKKYSDTDKLRFLLLANLVNAINVEFGQLNYIFISLLCQVVFLLTRLTKPRLKDYLKSLSIYGFSFLLLSFHALYPTLKLFSTGYRGSEGITYTQGSFTPVSFATLFYPYPFGDVENYKGELYSEDLRIQEFYIYVGVTSLLVALFGFLKMSDMKLWRFLSLISGIFLILGFIKYIPVLSNLNIPPLNLFRYWGRTSLYLVLATAFFAGYTTEHFKEKINISRIVLVFTVAVYLLSIEILSKPYLSTVILNDFQRGGFVFGIDFKVWSLLGSLTLLVLLVKFRDARLRSYLLIILVVFDILFFGLLSIKHAFKAVPLKQDLPEFGRDMDNKRVVFLDDSLLNGNKHLYLRSWSLLGYSGPYESKLFSDYLVDLGFENQRRTGFKVDLNNPKPGLVENLHALGVRRLYAENMEYIDIPYDEKNIDLVHSSEISSEYLVDDNGEVKYEGRLGFSVENQTDHEVMVQSLVRKYDGWNIKVDGKRVNSVVDMDPLSEIYLKFPVVSGEHKVELKYVPKDLLIGWGITGVLLVGGLIVRRIKVGP